jgi:hypothetical protein
MWVILQMRGTSTSTMAMTTSTIRQIVIMLGVLEEDCEA